MAKILLVAINSRYNHTNPAVRSITAYADSPLVNFCEWTISQNLIDLIYAAAAKKSDVFLFSVYIWNSPIVFSLIRELRKLLPNAVFGVGGPEVSYRGNELFTALPELDCILEGEGEQTVLEIVQHYKKQKFCRSKFLEGLGAIKGVRVKTAIGAILFAGVRPLIKNLASLPFAYPRITEPDTHIYYYESSRGCPFRCSYCLSSIDKAVRFMPLERVLADMQKFLDERVKLVKYVDRTFNLDTKRYLAIWDYLCSHHNGYTMFHFEISAENLDEEALDFLQNVPAGIMQFEIGIQTINKKTLKEIQRPADIIKLAKNIRRIPKTIRCHLDLIAGLPHENLSSFAKSFNYAIALKPDMLQLGFLKILSGTAMEKYALEHQYAWLSLPPYEVLQTPDMSRKNLCFLKDLEKLLDWYYNSGNFKSSMNFILSAGGRNKEPKSPFKFFSLLADWFRQISLFDTAHKPLSLFAFLHQFWTENQYNCIFYELLRFDYMCMGKMPAIPTWFDVRYDKNAHHQALLKHTDLLSGLKSTREAYARSGWEQFSIDPLAANFSESIEVYENNLQQNSIAFLFLYQKNGTSPQIIPVS